VRIRKVLARNKVETTVVNRSFDAAGRLITTTLPNGVATVNSYDDANRLTGLRHEDPGQELLLAEFLYQLDGVGNRVVATETLRVPLADVTAGQTITLTGTPGHQRVLDLVYNANAHEYLMVWSDPNDILAQRLDVSGVPISITVTVHVTTTGTQTNPAVAYDPVNDRYLVVWQDGRSGVRHEVYGRILDGEGQPLGAAEFLIEESGDDPRPDVIYDPDSGDWRPAAGRVAVWQRVVTSPNNRNIRAQFIDSDGQLGTIVDVDTTSAQDYLPALATDRQGGFPSISLRAGLAVWRRNSTAANRDIHGQRFTITGTVGSALEMATFSGEQNEPRISYHAGSGRYLIIWEDAQNGGKQAHARFVAQNGDFIGNPFRLDEEDEEAVRWLDVAAFSDNF
jgi:YD repeat-containing protein